VAFQPDKPKKSKEILIAHACKCSLQITDRALCSSGIPCSVKPRTAADKCTKDDVYFCCSSAFGQPKLQMNSEQKVDAAFRQPLLHKAACWL